jgi:hypothetical protein
MEELQAAADKKMAESVANRDLWGIISSYFLSNAAGLAAQAAGVSNGDKFDIVMLAATVLPLAGKVDNVVDATKDSKALTKRNFRDNLAKRTAINPADAHAHHNLPIKYEDKFDAAGINIHDPAFGSWWEKQSHLSNAKAFNDRWEAFFEQNREPTRTQIEQFARQIATEFGQDVWF